MGKDIHVVSMDVEAIAVIKKNRKKYNTSWCWNVSVYGICKDGDWYCYRYYRYCGFAYANSIVKGIT